MSDQLLKTRQSLLLRLKRQENDAWLEFLSIYEEAIFRYCRSRGLQDADAWDATQEVLAAVHNRVDSWDCKESRGSLRAWLFRVARNVAIDTLRRRRKQATASGDSEVGELLAELPTADEKEATAFQLEYRRAMFHWAAEEVRPEVQDTTWRSFWMTAVEGQSAEEVAKLFGLSLSEPFTQRSAESSPECATNFRKWTRSIGSSPKKARTLLSIVDSYHLMQIPLKK
jgi:RNA polymerase sigma-70 factor (ECF subfamily)